MLITFKTKKSNETFNLTKVKIGAMLSQYSKTYKHFHVSVSYPELLKVGGFENHLGYGRIPGVNFNFSIKRER